MSGEYSKLWVWGFGVVASETRGDDHWWDSCIIADYRHHFARGPVPTLGSRGFKVVIKLNDSSIVVFGRVIVQSPSTSSWIPCDCFGSVTDRADFPPKICSNLQATQGCYCFLVVKHTRYSVRCIVQQQGSGQDDSVAAVGIGYGHTREGRGSAQGYRENSILQFKPPLNGSSLSQYVPFLIKTVAPPMVCFSPPLPVSSRERTDTAPNIRLAGCSPLG